MGIAEEDGAPSFRAYPNPFIDELKLDLRGMPDTGKNYSLMVFDLSGKVVFTMQGRQLPAVVSMEPLPQGVYVLEISNGDHINRQKLLKLSER